MLTGMRELLQPVLSSVSTLMTQFQAALSIPLTDAAQQDESEATVSDSTMSREHQRSIGNSFKCVDDRPGFLTGNGLGSFEIGGALDD